MEDDKYFADIPVKRSPVYTEFYAKMSKDDKLTASFIQAELKRNRGNKLETCRLDLALVNFYLTIEPEHKGFLLRKKFITVRLEWLNLLTACKTTHMAMKSKWKAGVPRHPLAVELVKAFDEYVAYCKQEKNVE